MKVLSALRLLVLPSLLTASAAQSRADHTVSAEGFAITLPDAWTHDPTDTFGFLIRPAGEKQKKVRIHATGRTDASPVEAANFGTEKIREIRSLQKKPQETILSSTEIMTDSGITGYAMEVGGETSHLTRIYFKARNGNIVCVCIYHFGDKNFGAEARERVVRSLNFS